MTGLDGRIEIEGCDTIPKLFWHQVQGARRPHRLPREGSRHLARDVVARLRRARALAAGMGLVKLGLKRGEVVSILAETVPEWLYADMGTMGAGGVTNGIYPTDSAKQVDYILNDSRSRFLFVENEEQLDKFLEVRERCPTDRQGLRLRHGRPGRLQRPAWSCRSTSCWRSAARTTRRIPACGRSCVAGSKARGARAAGLHLRHHRPAQGRDAVASQRHLPDAQRRRLHPARHRRRAARLPAALPHRRAHLHRLPAAALRRHRQLRRERRDGAGEHPRGGADHLLRRAAHLGALLFRHRHPHEGGDLDRPHGLPVGARHRPQGGRGGARRAARPSPALEAAARASPTSWCSTTSSAPSACTACASPAPAPRRSRPT